MPVTLSDFNVDTAFSKVLQDFFSEYSAVLSAEWSALVRTQNLLEKCNMTLEYFHENIAKKVIEHFVKIVQGEAVAGDCPVMNTMVERFENHEMRVEDVYLICSDFKRTVSNKIMAFGDAELMRSMHQFTGLLDYNLYYLLQHYSTRYELIAASNQMQERLAFAQSLAKIGSFSYDAVSGEMLWSDQVYRILSYDKTQETPELSKLLSCCVGDGRRLLQEQFSKREGEGEYRLENGNAPVHFAVIRSASTFDENGRLLRVRGTLQDVTQLKENELELKRLNQELRSSETQYRTLFESLPIGVVMHDSSGAIIASNPAASKILKLPRDAIEQRQSIDPQWKTVREDGSVFPSSEHPVMRALRYGEKVRNVVMGLQHLEEEIWISINAEPLFGADGTMTHVIVSFAEITEQVTTSRRLDLLSKVFTHAQEGIIILDSGMQIIELNDAYLQMCECQSDALLFTSFREGFLKETGSDTYQQIENSLKSTGRWNGEIRRHRSGGTLQIQLLSIVAVEDIIGRVHNYLAVFSDITDRKKSEEAMIEAKARVDELNRTLHHEVEEAVSELRRKDELMIAQSRLAAMGEMIGMIAHQWRQPLTVIGITVSNVTTYMDLGISDDEKVRSAMQSIENQIKHLSGTIDDFRNFFKPEKKRAPVSLGTLLKRTLEIIATSLENSNIRIELDIENDTEMLLFEREMMQVLLNIFNNAKDAFTESATTAPHLLVRLRHDAQNAVIAICDNAGGIEETVMKRIFEPYFTTKGEKNGTGLGLYMSKTIVEKHMQGRLNASNVDGGACFEIILPKEITEQDA